VVKSTAASLWWSLRRYYKGLIREEPEVHPTPPRSGLLASDPSSSSHLPLYLALRLCAFIMDWPPMQPCASHGVFISYAHRDGADLARRLQKDLATKFDACLDTQRLSAGDIWSSEIEQAIDRDDVVLALLSAGSFISDICRAEQGRALDKGKCILPLRVQSDCDIPLQIQTHQWLDFSNLRLYPEQLPKLIPFFSSRSWRRFTRFSKHPL